MSAWREHLLSPGDIRIDTPVFPRHRAGTQGNPKIVTCTGHLQPFAVWPFSLKLEKNPLRSNFFVNDITGWSVNGYLTQRINKPFHATI
jgi:hypothetical protein